MKVAVAKSHLSCGLQTKGLGIAIELALGLVPGTAVGIGCIINWMIPAMPLAATDGPWWRRP